MDRSQLTSPHLPSGNIAESLVLWCRRSAEHVPASRRYRLFYQEPALGLWLSALILACSNPKLHPMYGYGFDSCKIFFLLAILSVGVNALEEDRI